MVTVDYPPATPGPGNGLGLHPAFLRFTDANDDRPPLLPVSPAIIPLSLREQDRWVVWKLEPKESDPADFTKLPYIATNTERLASSTDPVTWRTFSDAWRAYTRGDVDGVGFMLGDGVAGIDLDHCRDIETGEIETWATDIIDTINSYTEVSPSGCGVKIFVAGSFPPKGRRKGQIELYDCDRYFTMTGHHLAGTPHTVEARQEQLEQLHARVFPPAPPKDTRPVAVSAATLAIDDSELLKVASHATNGAKFDRLFGGEWSDHTSRSEADLALCSMLAFWTGRDHDRIDRLYRQSGLMREKWDTRRGTQTYGDITIEKAIASCSQTYSPGSRARTSAPPASTTTTTPRGVTLEDFHGYMPTHNYIFAPSREMWPATSVNARIAPVQLLNPDGTPALADDGRPKRIKASEWIDQHRAVEQMTWVPGMSMLITDKLVSEGGWISRPGCTTFNLYRPPQIELGDPDKAGPWRKHVSTVYPDDAEHIIAWLAHRAQRPAEKVNHAIVMGGAQGIGKDTILEPVKAAIGPWNFCEVSPQHLLGRFNGFVKSVILRISETRDLGDVARYAFYDHLKIYTAAPPDVLRVDEKHLREYAVWNVCGVIITTNHRTDGLYLPADDRRHYVAWSEKTKADFPADYWTQLYRWYAEGGVRHVAAFLADYDLSRFDPKAPPPKTAAFYDCVDANRAPEDAELADALDQLKNPQALTLADLAGHVPSDFGDWLRDRKNARQIPHRLEAAGYVAVRNPTAKDGLWRVGGKRQAIYAQHELSVRDRIAAATTLGSEKGSA